MRLAALLIVLTACGDYNPPDARVVEVLNCQEDPGGPISRGGIECRVRTNEDTQVTVCGVVAEGDCIIREGLPGECWETARDCYCRGGCR